MAAEGKAQEVKRRKRVNLYKKIIIGFLLLAFLVPMAFCCILLSRTGKLNQQLKQLGEDILSLQNSLEEMSQTRETVPGEQAVQQADVQSSTDDSEEAETVKLRKVYLTFDDGPSSNTDNILDILSAYDVKATFFVTGKETDQAKAAYKRIVAEGHTLGLHSYTHNYETIYASVDAFGEDITKLQDYLYEVTGVKVHFLRFPGGSSNKVSSVDMRELIAYVHGEGMEYYDWNVSSQDATSPALTKEQILDNCLNNIEKYDNVIILMHDAGSKDSTVEALPELIERIQAMENTQLLPITDETIPVQHIKSVQEETED